MGALLGMQMTQQSSVFERLKPSLLPLGITAIALHGFILYHSIYTGIGEDFGFFNAISLITWLMAILWLIPIPGKPIETLGIIILPLASLALLMNFLFPPTHRILEEVHAELGVHIFLAILAYALLTIAAVQAVLLFVQERQLRHKHPGGFIRALPPLQTMETLLFRIIGIGFVLLSFALFSGLLFLEDIFTQHLLHKTVLSIVSWILFAILLWGRWRFGWRGRTAIRWTLGAFLLLMLAFLGSKFALEIILQR
jgi:ABC-type uncharacterized transport system permease subunit